MGYVGGDLARDDARCLIICLIGCAVIVQNDNGISVRDAQIICVSIGE